MSMEEDFLSLIRANKDVVGMIGNRLSLDVRPQDSDEPAIVVSRISGGHEHQITGSAGYAMPVLHVMCFAPSAVSANRLRDYARMALQGVGNKVVGQTKFLSLILDDEDHDYLPPIDASDRGTFARLLVFLVLHEEPIPQFN
jgi:hypothetical protein